MEEIFVRLGLDKQSALGVLWSFVPNVISAFVVVLLVVIFYLITARIFEAALRKTTMQVSLVKITVRSLYRGLVIIVGLILVLGQLGINVTAAIAGVGVLGLAVGFAAQQTLANIFSGFGIFVDKLYAAGDWVKVADNYGEVVSISLRTTKIRTLDNTFISVPNSLVTSSPVTNYSEEGLLRITARVSIGHKESVDKARAALLKTVSEIKGVKKKPVPMVVVDKLGESSVELLVRIWVDEPGFEQKYYFLLTEACKQALDKAKISIPFPQRDIHIISKTKGKTLKKK
jgi:small conductance mechanosensitive channel